MKPALIDFHSLVTVWAPQLTEGVLGLLRQQFPIFLREHDPVPPSRPDIILKTMGDPPPVTDTMLRTSALFGFSVFHYQETIAVGLLHRGVPDVLITLSDPITIVYRPRAGIQGRLYGVLLLGIHLCLRKKGALLAHGAVVEKGGKSLILSGHRGTGKTQLLLSFLHQRWNYIGDDKFILYKGKAYLFESRIYIRDHLYACLPWLRTVASRSALQQGATVLRQNVRPIVYRVLGRRSPYAVERVLDPAAQYDIKTLFPSCSERIQAAPNHAFLLFQGRDLAIGAISRQPAIEALSNIIILLFSDMDSMERMLALYSGVDGESLQSLITQNLPDIPFHKVILPELFNPEEVCQEMLSCCEAL